GINSRLDSIQAAMLSVKLKYVDEWSEARRKRAARYTQLIDAAALSERVIPPSVKDESRHIFHQYVVRVPERRDELREHLSAKGITTKIYYPVPLHLQKCFRYLGYREGDFPEAESAALETFALPLFPELTEDQQVYVVQAMQNFF